MAEHNFKEQKQAYSKKSGMIPVWQSPKYLESKEAAIKMIESGKYGLTDGDFWILMNEGKGRDGNPMMVYTGLIISHNGCMKINDHSENQVNPQCFSCNENGYGGSLVYYYCDSDTYEVGEVSAANCRNNYPYAMAFKRCYDRVVLKKSKLAFSGIYSESEADEFKAQPETEETAEYKNPEIEENTYKEFIENVYFKTFPDEKEKCLKRWKIKSIEDIDKVLTKEQIDRNLKKMKLLLAKELKTGIYSEEETY